MVEHSSSKEQLAAIRQAVADYMWSEGCTCCQNVDKHEADKAKLGELLGIKPEDGYYNFSNYRTKAHE